MTHELTPHDEQLLRRMGIADSYEPLDRAAINLRLARERAEYCERQMGESYRLCLLLESRLTFARYAAAILGVLAMWGWAR